MKVTFSQKAGQIALSSTISIDTKSKQLKSEGKHVIDFGIGEPDFETPAHIKDAGIRAIQEGFTRYTGASGIPELKDVICTKLARDNNLIYRQNQIAVSNGAKHALSNVFAAILNEGDEVIIPAPYWVSYPELVRIHGGIPVIVETSVESNFKLNMDSLDKHITSKTKAIVINSPSNPTGQVYTRKELEYIASVAVQNNIFVVSDEVYESFIYSGKHVSIAALGDSIKNLTIIVNGVSKTYAMTGWRIGYTASCSELALLMSNLQSHMTSNPNSIAQKAAYTALADSQECVGLMHQAFQSRRDCIIEQIDKVKLLSYVKPQGAFYLFVDVSNIVQKKYKGQTITSSKMFAEILLDEFFVTVIPGDGFGAPDFIRLSFATSVENIKTGLERIGSFISKLQ